MSDKLDMLFVLDIVEFGDMVYLEGLISAIVDKDMRELFLQRGVYFGMAISFCSKTYFDLITVHRLTWWRAKTSIRVGLSRALQALH